MTNREAIAALAEIVINCLCDPVGVGEFFQACRVLQSCDPSGIGQNRCHFVKDSFLQRIEFRSRNGQSVNEFIARRAYSIVAQ